MAETPAIPAFSGDSWDQCSTLIHAVRNAAYREGKIRDQDWMADLASVNFTGEALAWYALLPRDVQEDWSKLQIALANRWSTQKSEFQAFSGDNWDECSTLIHNVRDAAWREGKIQDQAWMANLASIHFKGEALAWYARLPREVQEDWSKLQAALSNRWSTPVGEYKFALYACSSWIGSQDAAAPEDVTATDGQSDSPPCGLLKAVDNGSGTTWYLQWGQNASYFNPTQDVKQAARFRSESQSTSTLLEFVSAGGYPWLAIHWNFGNPNVGQGSIHNGYISAVDSETMKSSYNISYPFQILKFRFLSSGEVVPVRKAGKTETDLTAFTQGTTLLLAPDPEAFKRSNPSWSRLALYFQKIEE